MQVPQPRMELGVSEGECPMKSVFFVLAFAILADVALGMPVKVRMSDLNGMRQDVLNVAHSFQNFEYVHAIESSFSIKHK